MVSMEFHFNIATKMSSRHAGKASFLKKDKFVLSNRL